MFKWLKSKLTKKDSCPNQFQGPWAVISEFYPMMSATGEPIKKGDCWVITCPGTLGGEQLLTADRLHARVDNPRQHNDDWEVHRTVVYKYRIVPVFEESDDN